jgi:acetyl-CoA carboxylase carboxyl transferase subunit beta
MAAWFKRTPQETQGSPKKVVIAEGLWIKCESCKEIMYRAEVDKAGRVCPKCHYPFRINARERIALLSDPGSFEEYQASLASIDPLGFKDTKRYRDRIRTAKQKTSMQEAVMTGLARIGGYPTMLCVFEFAFLGGSMGSAVGEKLTRSIEMAIDKQVPVIIVSASGSGWRIVSAMTRGPAKPMSARGSARFTSPSIAKLAVTPPVVGSVSTDR